MEFGNLGPVEVWDKGHRRPLGGSKQRALLVALFLHANEAVPADRLIDDLWGEDSSDAATALRVNVSRLRKALPPDTLTTRSPGYMIGLGPDQLDLYRFEGLVDVRGLAGRDIDHADLPVARERDPRAIRRPAQEVAIAIDEEPRIAAVSVGEPEARAPAAVVPPWRVEVGQRFAVGRKAPMLASRRTSVGSPPATGTTRDPTECPHPSSLGARMRIDVPSGAKRSGSGTTTTRLRA